MMPYSFLAYNNQQMYLPPASIVKWVRGDSLARFVEETVDLLEASRGGACPAVLLLTESTAN